MSQKHHWEKIYRTRQAEELGWYERHLRTSLLWIEELGLDAGASIIDVGGGASTLVDDLLAAGFRSLTVLDLAEQALAASRLRLGQNAGQVTWLTGDIATVELPQRHYALWHDRALFHFFVKPEQQQAYRQQLLQALRPGGYLLIGTFAPDAPPTCSGLPVQRYSPAQLAAVLGEGFVLQRHHQELHTTPGGVQQLYLYGLFKKLS